MCPGPAAAYAAGMERATALLLDGFQRVQDDLRTIVAGLSAEQLAWPPGPRSNTIAWLGWHLARIQDDHVAQLVDREQVYVPGGWADRFALPFDPAATGYGQTPEDAQRVRATADLLTGYYDAVHERTVEVLRALPPQEYDRVVDRRWDPPVTLAVRVVSVLNDVTQHIGQAGYVRGLLPH